MSVPVPSTPTNPADDLREQVANALADSNLREVGDDGTLVRPFAAKSPMAFAYANAALSVVNPVLKGLHAEVERLTEVYDRTHAALRQLAGSPPLREDVPMGTVVARLHRVLSDLDRAVVLPEDWRARVAAAFIPSGDEHSCFDRVASLIQSWQTPPTPGPAALAHAMQDAENARDRQLPTWDQLSPHSKAARVVEAGRWLAALRPSVSDQTPATPDGSGEWCNCQSANTWHPAGDTADCAPSSVQGDTTPREECATAGGVCIELHDHSAPSEGDHHA